MIRAFAIFLALSAASCHARRAVVIGSKKFTESVILGELGVQLLRGSGIEAAHRDQLGGSRVLWSALLRGEIDAYPEYTGTLRQDLLKDAEVADLASLRQELERQGVRIVAPLGFDNTYALGVREDLGERLGLRKISDLALHPELRLGFSEEFRNRADGWPAVKETYGLSHSELRSLDHDVAYRGLRAGQLDVVDLYVTDAEIGHEHIRLLEDDRHCFPEYLAIWLVRADLDRRAAGAITILDRLTGKIAASQMALMNARARIDHAPEARVAAEFLSSALHVAPSPRGGPMASEIMARTLEHLGLVVSSLLAAIVVSIPLGILSARRRRFGRLILGIAGVIQTIPSLVVLVLMIPLLGIGGAPAMVALFLYSLLPIIQATTTGLLAIPAPLVDSAKALGLGAWARLRLVEMPLASPSILAGIKTSAVINVGTATLGAIIGAGGYGQPILTGIRLDDLSLILAGAVPAAAMALLAQLLFDGLERVVVPKGLRLESRG